VPECPTSWDKDACALKRPSYPRNIPLKQGYRLIIEKPLQIRPVMRIDNVGPVTMGQIVRGPSGWTRPRGGATSP
jgi:hypothetical protein